jgi:IPT/TIG domain
MPLKSSKFIITFLLIIYSSPSFAIMYFNKIKPSSGPWGTKVLLYGRGFDKKTVKVYFNNKIIKPESITKSVIIVKIPEKSVTGWFEVEQDGRRNRAPSRFVVKNLTVVNSIVPNSGPVGIWVVAKGYFLKRTTSFYMGLLKLKTKFISETEVKLYLPVGVKTNFFYYKRDRKKIKTKFKYNVKPFPTINNYSPKIGWYGDKVVIKGKNFCKNVKLFIDNKIVKLKTRRRNYLMTRIPSGSKTSKPYILCFNKKFYLNGNIQIKPPFGNIKSISPKIGIPGTWVILNGERFSKKDRFWFGSKIIKKKKFINSKKYKIQIPPNSKTEIFHHESFNRIRPTDKLFTIIYPPVINSFSPSNGWYGTSVKIKGKNFCSTVSVKIGKKIIKNVTAISAKELIVKIPENVKSGEIRVFCRNIESKSKIKFIIKPPALKVLSGEPLVGPPGTIVELKGKYFPKNLKVFFRNRSLKVKYVDSETVLVTIRGKSRGKLRVYGYNKYWSTNLKYLVAWPKPVPSSFSPKTSWHRGVITISGKKLCSKPLVFLNKKRLKVIKSKNGKITIVLPAKSSAGNIFVKCYQYKVKVPGKLLLKPPVGNIASIYPARGPIGTWIVVRGSNFSRKLTFYLGRKLMKTKFVSKTEIRVLVPKNSVSSKIFVKIGRTKVKTSFKFAINYPKPLIELITPDMGWTNDKIRIAGKNFCMNVKVVFPGNKTGKILSKISHTNLVVKVPKGGKSGYLKIVCPKITGVSTNYFTMAPPYSRVHTVDPTLACPGDKIKLTGINFTKKTKFYLGMKLLKQKLVNKKLVFVTIPKGSRSGDVKVGSFGKILSTNHSIIIKSRICKKRKK